MEFQLETENNHLQFFDENFSFIMKKKNELYIPYLLLRLHMKCKANYRQKAYKQFRVS